MARLARMKFCSAFTASRQYCKLGLHVKSLIPGRWDPSFVLPRYRLARKCRVKSVPAGRAEISFRQTEMILITTLHFPSREKNRSFVNINMYYYSNNVIKVS